MSDRNDKCGLYGVVSLETPIKRILPSQLDFLPHTELKKSLNESLVKLQHRGQESYGLSYLALPEHKLVTRKQLGLVSPIYITSLTDNFETAIGHVRYSTSKNSKLASEELKLYETQPLEGKTHKHGSFTLAHNGNIPHTVQQKLIDHYNISQVTHSDSETIIRLIEMFASQYDNFHDGIIKFLNTVEGVYNLLILTEQGDMYAIRDRHGVRPLTLAKLSQHEYHISSETCAFPEHSKIIRDIEAGELVRIHSPYTDKVQLSTIYKAQTSTPPTFCSFEYIYFMRSTSTFNQINVGDLRFRMGVHLATNEPAPIRSAIVIGMPNTAIPVGEGFASAISLPYHQYIKKAANCGRTFILPNNTDRLQRLRNKFLFNTELAKTTIYLCDDSIVRGNTMRELIHLLKTEHKVKEVHVRISSPPVVNVCHYGIDIPDKDTLIGATKASIEDIRTSIKADSLIYLTLPEMKKMTETTTQKVCTSCFDNTYNSKLLDW